MVKEIKCPTCDNVDCFINKYCFDEWKQLIAGNKPTLLFRKNEKIIREGDKVEGIYFLYEGKAKIHKRWIDNKEYIVRLASSGNILGHRGFGGDLLYPISATALEDCRICFVDNELFFRTLKTNNEFTYQLLLFYAEELKVAEARMRNLAHLPVKKRIAESLLIVDSAFGVDPKTGFLDWKITRKDLAALSGTTYETVIRMLSELSAEGLVEVNGKYIRIINKTALVDLFEEKQDLLI